MIKIYLSESILSVEDNPMEIVLNINESDLQTMIKIAKSNKLDIAIINTDDK